MESNALCVTPSMAVFCEWESPEVELLISRGHSRIAEKNVANLEKFSYKTPSDGLISLLETLHSKQQPPQQQERIKLGYICSYVSEHIVAFIMEEIFKLHDTTIFEVFVYAVNPPDGMPCFNFTLKKY